MVELQNMAETPISLDAPLIDDEQYHLADTLEDTSTTAPADAVTHQALRVQICHALEELSAFFKLTRERIRQIEVKALRTLRQPIQVRLLRDFA